MAAPCALVASCSDINPRDLVTQILGVEELPQAEHVLEEVESFPWHVDTKYYMADVAICTSATRTIGNQDFASSVQAIILLFDSKQEASFEKVHSWLPFAHEIDAPMQMLVTERCQTGDAVAKARIHSWCLKHSFELIELDPETFSDEEEDDFPETTGVKRIIQSLHAHMWPNLVMKDHPTFRSPYMNQMIASQAKSELSADNDSNETESRVHDESGLSESAVEGTDKTTCTAQPEPPAKSALQDSTEQSKSQTAEENKDLGTSDDGQAAVMDASTKADKEKANNRQAELLDSMINSEDIALFASLGNEESSEESFEQLFEKMRVMKQRAETLPPEQRKAYAEKVAITFWKAIGGDEDEIDGLSDEELP